MYKWTFIPLTSQLSSLCVCRHLVLTTSAHWASSRGTGPGRHAAAVQTVVRHLAANFRGERVFVRASVPGHPQCHLAQVRAKSGLFLNFCPSDWAPVPAALQGTGGAACSQGSAFTETHLLTWLKRLLSIIHSCTEKSGKKKPLIVGCR